MSLEKKKTPSYFIAFFFCMFIRFEPVFKCVDNVWQALKFNKLAITIYQCCSFDLAETIAKTTQNFLETAKNENTLLKCNVNFHEMYHGTLLKHCLYIIFINIKLYRIIFIYWFGCVSIINLTSRKDQ